MFDNIFQLAAATAHVDTIDDRFQFYDAAVVIRIRNVVGHRVADYNLFLFCSFDHCNAGLAGLENIGLRLLGSFCGQDHL